MKCQSCGSDKSRNVYTDLLDECVNCGLVRADERFFSTLDAEDLYSEKYFKGAEYENYENDKLALQKNFGKRLDSVLQRTKNEAITSVLEIGCAYGYFYETLKHRIECKYFGIDVSKDAVEEALRNYGPHFRSGNFIEEGFDQLFTDVFMWDVIEHLDRPSDFFKKVWGLLPEGGRIYITTGDIGALIPKIQKSNWRMIHPPSHLFYFSKKTIRRFLENHGFEVQKIEYPSIYRSICLIYYSLFILRREKPKKFHLRILKMINPSWFVPLNTFDIMFVTAVKKSK